MTWTKIGNIKGTTGSQGIPGATGSKGDKGDKGDQGIPGADSTVPGPPGATGATGAASTVPGPQGPPGAASTVPGPPGPGVAAGGTTGQVLTKINATDYNSNWQTPATGLALPLAQTLTFSPDSTFDIGAAAASRPRDLFLGRNAAVGGTLGVTGATTLAGLTVSGALVLPTGSVTSTMIADGTVSNTDLAAGAATANVGALGGVLGGTLPNPTLAAGAAATNVGALSGVLGGTLPSPTMAAGAAATNVGTLGGVLTGTLPNPGLATGSVTTTQIADGTIATVDIANAAVTNAKLASDTARANLLTNGGFEIWQRGNGPFTANVAYTADRWVTSINSGSLSVSRDAVTVDAGSQYSCSFSCTYSGVLNRLQQTLVEVAPQVQGRVITFSARTRCATANALRLNVYADTNSGGGAGVVQATSGFDPGSGAWNTLSVSITIPVGANYLVVRFEMVATCSGNLDNAMLVVGSVAADYVPMHPADDLARCLRYYEVLGDTANGVPLIGGYTTAGATVYINVFFAAKKAVTPTCTKNGTWNAVNAGQPAISAPATHGILSSVVVTSTGLGYSVPSAAGQNIIAEANP